MPIPFEHLTAPTAADHARIRAIYEHNFEPVDKKPYALIEQGVAAGDIWLYVTRDPAGEIVGFASLVRLPTAPAMYLVYLAVDHRMQGQGLGAHILTQVTAALESATDCNALVWEVHPPHPTDPAHNDSRRIRFYERQGAELLALGQPYRMPAPDNSIVPMRLMWLPLRGRTARPTRSEVIAWVTGIFHWVYPGQEDLLAAITADITALEDHTP